MDNIGYLLMKVSKDLRYALTKELSLYGLTASQWAVLKQLDLEEGYESPLTRRTAVEISSKLDFDKPTMSGIVNRLYEKGMIHKGPHPNDKRASILFLTAEAKILIPKIELLSNRVMDESLIDVSFEEKQLFLQVLRKIDRTFSMEGKK